MSMTTAEFLAGGAARRPSIPLLPPKSPYKITEQEDPGAADRYARDNAWEASRDRWDKPLVRTPEGDDEGYRRASSYGGPLESSELLENWRLRKVAEGFVLDRGPLRLSFSREMARLQDAEAAGVVDEITAAKKAQDDLCQKAMDLAGAHDKADIGTAIHDICERYDRGVPLGHVPEEWWSTVEAWQRLIADFEVLSIERIVVNHEFKVGGKLDRVARTRRPFVVRKARRKYKGRPARPPIILPAGEVIIVDQKTSGSMDFAQAKFGCQGRIYATATPYNPITRQDEPWGHEAPSHDWAAVLHTPSGEGTGYIYWIDLRQAGGAMVDAHTCYEWRNKWGRHLIDTVDPALERDILAEHFAETATAAASVDELFELHRQAKVCDCWTDDLAARFTARRLELAS
jgi:hypothetical protein